MANDVVTAIHVMGLRTLADVKLKLSPLTVLTGTNGSGKSTLIEACEILRRLASPTFLHDFILIHGGMDALLSHGSRGIRLGVRIENQTDAIEYDVHIEDIAGLAITSEQLRLVRPGDAPVELMTRQGVDGRVFDLKSGEYSNVRPVPGAKLLLTGFGLRVPHPAITRVIWALENIEIHVPFAVVPGWVDRSLGLNTVTMRVSQASQSADSLSRLGTNLAVIYRTLREEHDWETTMDYVRLGLGQDIENVLACPTQSGDGVEIFLKYHGFETPVPARSLSDGTLSYLAFVALFRISPKRSLMAFDEPENQLHPVMANRVIQFLETMSERCSILIATHSDRLLDALSNPAESVVLCSLDAERNTQLVRPDPVALAKWLEDYRGLGDVRGAGHEGSVMTVSQPSASGKKD